MKSLGTLAIFAALLAMQACGNGNNNQDSVDSAKALNSDKDTTSMMHDSAAASTTPVNKDVADFAVEAADGGMMEVQLGKLAQDKAVNPRIKDFGKMMVDDHTQLGNKLMGLAKQKNITLPATESDKCMKAMDELNKKSGTDFDKAYMKMMLDDHKDDIKAFEKAGNDLPDADVKAFAMQALPTLQKHLDSAQAITGKK
jgi:putative membrane protein